MRKTQTIRLRDIQELANKIALDLRGGEILALIGPLGAGKTAFAKALAKNLKVKQTLTSPTFTLLHCFPARLQNRPINFYHLDLYRIRDFREVQALGLEEFWGNPHTVTLIEWADKIKKYWPSKGMFIINFQDD